MRILTLSRCNVIPEQWVGASSSGSLRRLSSSRMRCRTARPTSRACSSRPNSAMRRSRRRGPVPPMPVTRTRTGTQSSMRMRWTTKAPLTMTTPDGLLIVDKSAGWTSHDVVACCRRLCGTRRVGHAGTLDPMATGVLVLGINRATKLLTFLVGSDKTYTATIRLGQSTITDDAQGEITTSHDVAGLSVEVVERAVAGLTGEIAQVPSSVSALKVDGRRSYARVRAGQDVVLPARPVTVSRFDIPVSYTHLRAHETR